MGHYRLQMEYIDIYGLLLLQVEYVDSLQVTVDITLTT